MANNRADEHPLESELSEDGDENAISTRATIYCPKCGYKRIFRNRFPRESMEMIVVSTKILDWMTCERCNIMLSLRLEYEI